MLVCHGDIRGQNIIMKHDEAVLIDFGNADFMLRMSRDQWERHRNSDYVLLKGCILFLRHVHFTFVHDAHAFTCQTRSYRSDFEVSRA